MNTVRLVFLSLVLSIFSLAMPRPSIAEEPPPWLEMARQIAMEEAAGRTGASLESLVVVAEAVRDDGEVPMVELKISGDTVEVFAHVGVDAEGRVIDLEEMDLRAEEIARDAGRIDPSLAARMAADPDAVQPILIWLSEPPFEPLEPPAEPPADDAALDSFDYENASALAAHLEPLFAVMAERLGVLGLDGGQSENAPMMWTEATRDQVEMIAEWPETARVFADEEFELLLDVAGQAIFADDVHATGNRGAFGRIGMVESAPYIAHPALLNGARTPWVVRQRTSCKQNNEHATIVLSVMKSVNATHPGIAPHAKTWAGGACTMRHSDLMATSDQVIKSGAWVINMSFGLQRFGALGAFDRYIDSVARRRFRTFVVAAGNDGDHPNSAFKFVQSPATAYAAIAVGSFDDHGSADRRGDTMAAHSSWRDPRSRRGDRVKPEVVAPGKNIYLPNHGAWWKDVSGTSVAAPMVTASAGLVLEAQPWLYFLPEALRAVLVAGATHNLEGPDGRGAADGFGGLDADAAVDIARVRKGNWGQVQWGCEASLKRTLATVDLPDRQLFRAAITWTADPSFPQNRLYDIHPGADIDLWLVGDNGQILARSSSFDGAVEVLVARVPAQRATLQIRLATCTQAPGRIGWAFFNDGMD